MVSGFHSEHPSKTVDPLLCNQAARTAECSYRPSLVVHDLEHRVQLHNLQYVVNLLGQVQELQLAALVANRSNSANQSDGHHSVSGHSANECGDAAILGTV